MDRQDKEDSKVEKVWQAKDRYRGNVGNEREKVKQTQRQS